MTVSLPPIAQSGLVSPSPTPFSGSLLVTDTIPLPKEKQSPKIKVLSVAPLLADAIMRIHEDNSVSELFRHYGNH